jgi:hypothetical protein
MKGLNNPIGIKSLEPSQSPFIMNPFRFASSADPEFNSDLTTTDYWVFNDSGMGSINTGSTEINADSRSDGTNNWFGIDLEQEGIFGAGNLSQTDFDCRWNQLTNTSGLYAGWLHNYSGFSSTDQSEGYNTAQQFLLDEMTVEFKDSYKMSNSCLKIIFLFITLK